jgi:aspartyl-tRNA(Asn)/glutamyl-tRNA(Gln) amidotransferase subunit B
VTEYETVVGLEVHCELATATKLFCGCRNAFGDEPNTNICPVCLGLPGSLPVINRRAVELALRIGSALNCSAKRSIFHRKNYFYPDMPKDYQISQYDEPINVDGFLELPDGSRVGVERAHMEEDTGKTTHVGGGGRIHEAGYSLVDYNRAGVPLVEIVSRPDIRSAAQARAYVDELRSILVAAGASDGRMEEGSLRVDANVSVRPLGATEFGTRCEVKNLNSLRSLERAIDHEVERQIALLESGGRIAQETRHWDEGDSSTHSMRSKEEANDYRYFPEPDLTPLVPDAALLAAAADGVGPMPAERRHRLSELFAAGSELATRRDGSTDQVVTVVELGLDELVHGAVAAGADPRLALARAANEEPRPGRLRRPVENGVVGSALGDPVQAGPRRAHGPGRGPGRDRRTARFREDGHLSSRVDRRRGHRRQPRGVAAVARRRREGGTVPFRPGDEGLAWQGERQARRRGLRLPARGLTGGRSAPGP